MQSSRWPVSISHGSALRMAAASVLAVGLCSSVPAGAAPPADAQQPSSSWGLGVGAMVKQRPYKDIDLKSTAVPLIQFENKYVRLLGLGVEVKLPSLDVGKSQRLDFRIVGKYDGSGYEADDAPILAGMDERKGGFWAGAKVKWHNELADVSAEWLADASSHSKGQRFNLGLERTWRLGDRVMLTPHAKLAWQDKKYVDYYYGVRDSEVRANRAAYTGKSGVNPGIGVRGAYMFDKRHSMFLDVEVTSLAKGIKDSPLVDRSSEYGMFLGYLYRFQ